MKHLSTDQCVQQQQTATKLDDPNVQHGERYCRRRCCILTPPFRVEVLGANHDRVGALVQGAGRIDVTRIPEGSVDRRKVNAIRVFIDKSDFFVD